jgi:hypothetical protein
MDCCPIAYNFINLSLPAILHRRQTIRVLGSVSLWLPSSSSSSPAYFDLAGLLLPRQPPWSRWPRQNYGRHRQWWWCGNLTDQHVHALPLLLCTSSSSYAALLHVIGLMHVVKTASACVMMLSKIKLTQKFANNLIIQKPYTFRKISLLFWWCA